MNAKSFATSVLALMAASAALADGPADYPKGRIDVIIPFNPGGGVDATGRLMATEFESIFGQNVVVSNVSGAGGTIGATQLAESDADGYTIGLLPIGTATTQPHRTALPYNNESWEEVCLLVKSPLAVLVNPEGRFSSIQEIAAAAEAGDTVLVGGPPRGSVPHMAQAALGMEFGVEFQFVPYEGGAGASTAVLGNEVDFTVEPFGSGARLGLNPLVVLAPERVPDLPDVPAISEVVEGSTLDMGIWFGLFAPVGTPAPIVDKLAAACETTASAEGFVDGIANVGWNINYLGKSEFETFFQTQYSANGALMGALGLAGN